MKLLILFIILLSVGCASTVSSSVSSQNVTSGISSAASSSQQITSVPTGLIEMTLEELKQFDGGFGRKAYIAVDGFVYDVTGSSRWFLGNHNGYRAGVDLTFEIDNFSPHGRATLAQVPMIGRIVG
jgi:predicted heme/steroid binding protein